MHCKISRLRSTRVGSYFAASLGLIAALITIGGSHAQAQQAKVIKVQGKKAIVQFPDDSRPRVGQVIDLGGGIVSMDGGSRSSSGPGPRSMIVGGSAELSSSTKAGSSSSTTYFAADGRYGWNTGVMEYGGIGGFTYGSATGTSARLIEAGGFYDYNLVPNVSGTEIVYGGMATAKLGQIAATVGNAEYSGTVITLEVGGQLKWFPFGSAVAIRGDLLYRIESVADAIKNSSTTLLYTSGSGLVAKGGFYIYF